MVYLAEELVDAVSFLDCDRLPVARAVPVAVGNLHLQEVRKYIIQFSFTGGQQVHHPVFIYRSESTLSSLPLSPPLLHYEDILM